MPRGWPITASSPHLKKGDRGGTGLGPKRDRNGTKKGSKRGRFRVGFSSRFRRAIGPSAGRAGGCGFGGGRPLFFRSESLASYVLSGAGAVAGAGWTVQP